MARPQEVIRYVKRIRGKNERRDGQIHGGCVNIVEPVRCLGGAHWRSEKARTHPDQAWPGHSVGVFPTRGKSGVVAQYSGAPEDTRIIIGQVNRTDNPQKVAKQLKKITGQGGWEKK